MNETPPMTAVPVVPATAPFTAEQRAWLNGFLAGLCSRGRVDPVAASGAAAPGLRPLTILFGSQTGTAEALAKTAAKKADRFGFAATVVDMAGCPPDLLAREHAVLVITSTYGEGDPPDNAKALLAGLAAPAAPRLPALRFSVCALGDSHYTQFCKCGKDFDARLGELGGTRAHPRLDCDVGDDAKFEAWLPAALEALANEASGSSVRGSGPVPAALAAVTTTGPADTAVPGALATDGHSRSRPFPAPLLAFRVLNEPGGGREVRHFELSVEGSGLAYEPGDALGVWPQNCPDLVAEVLGALGCDGEEAVPVPDGSALSLRRALTACYDLGRPAPELLARYAAPAPARPGTDAAALHVIDVLLARPEVRLPPEEFVRLLRKLTPRLYSISSSPRAHAGQVHLTVATLRYETLGRARKGVCSTFLAGRCAERGLRVPVYLQANAAFRLPADVTTPLIMVGPGTGVAPFRAFLHERRAAGSRGRNWLFFGGRQAASDYLYRDELAGFARDGTLTRHDTAFSRDQAEKIYVQHRLREHARELFAWLEDGACFYVCGDASRMARDVDAALHEVVVRGGGRTAAEAAAYVQALIANKRYRRDVY